MMNKMFGRSAARLAITARKRITPNNTRAFMPRACRSDGGASNLSSALDRHPAPSFRFRLVEEEEVFVGLAAGFGNDIDVAVAVDVGGFGFVAMLFGDFMFSPVFAAAAVFPDVAAKFFGSRNWTGAGVDVEIAVVVEV